MKVLAAPCMIKIYGSFIFPWRGFVLLQWDLYMRHRHWYFVVVIWVLEKGLSVN